MTEYDFKGDVHCADFIGGDKNITYGFEAKDVERLIEKVLGFIQAGGVFQPLPENREMLQVDHEGQKLVFQPGAVRRLETQGMERAYLLSLTVNRTYQQWASFFVPLRGNIQVLEELPISFTEFIIPTGEAAAQGGQATQKPLEDITEAMQKYSAFVILGEPGAGKTTTQQKIAFESALSLLKNDGGRIPLFVRLSQQGGHDPYAFLKTEWERRTGIPFDHALRTGQILILADGINEIPRARRNEQLKAWMIFEEQYRGMNQLIFSGRDKDYDDQLNLPRVMVDSLDEPRVKDFLRRREAEGLAELLDDPTSKLGDMARNPLNLFVLVQVYLHGGKNLQLLANRGRLFQSFTGALIHHEQIWNRDNLSEDSKVDLFAKLAYDMQKQGSGTTFEFEAAQSSLPASVMVMGEPEPIDPIAFFRFGRGATVFDPATLPDVRFYHHLLQEYFAARELLRRFHMGEDLSAFWKAPRTKDEMPNEDVGEWDPLPEPPTKGWEVTTILACGLSNSPAKLIEAVRLHNPALAGRCLDEAGIPPLPEGAPFGDDKGPGVRAKVRSELLSDLYNPAMHLRTRLQAGFVLGKIGDPRFLPSPVRRGDGGEVVNVIVPQMVNVPAGKYLIGSKKGEEDSFDSEYPQHTVDLQAFSIGKWSVTNAEYACFMEAGGYENENYWQGDLAKRWLEGEDVSGGQFKSYIDVWNTLQTFDDVRKTLEQSANYTPDQIDFYEFIAKMTEDELKEYLGKNLSQKSRSQPAYWENRERNNPSQPVVGITWFEARAYCAWLSEGTGKQYRLPSEAEWEAAARGLPEKPLFGKMTARRYPWGDDWDKEKANSIEGRVMKPSPVGAYTAAGAVGPFGAEDQSGNVYDWTSSLYLPYPYDEGKSEVNDSAAERVARGGSWYDDRGFVRCANRNRFMPDFFLDVIGFRLVSPGFDHISGF
ncbi:MAG: SUMF1/EgtB/PvdO family nonheme iron enzyme [Chloroflexota bacterium]